MSKIEGEIVYKNGIGFLDCGDEEFCSYSVACEDSADKFYGMGIMPKSYELDDCVIVHTTDVFPFDGLIQTASHGNAIFKSDSDILMLPLLRILRQKYEKLAVEEELKKFQLYFKHFRSTIHFTINGLVGDHGYGTFSGRPYVILEPLKHQINNPALYSLAAHDTYFTDDVMLSDEAIIIISEEEYKTTVSKILSEL